MFYTQCLDLAVVNNLDVIMSWTLVSKLQNKIVKDILPEVSFTLRDR